MNDEPKFVNRRGHAQRIETEEVLRIDGETVEVDAKKRNIRSKRPRKQLRLARWQKWTIMGLLVVLVTLPIGVGETVRTDYEKSTADALQRVTELTTATVLPQQKKLTLTAKEMTTVVGKLSAIRDGMCSGAFVDNIASLYPRAKTALEACLQTRNTVDALASAMADSTEQLMYLEQIVPIFSATRQPEEERFAVLTSQKENWQSLVEGLKQLNPPTSFRSVHGVLIQKAEAVTSSWTEVLNAFSAQDSTAFSAASAKVAAAYAEIRSTADAFQSVLDVTQNRLTAAQRVIL